MSFDFFTIFKTLQVYCDKLEGKQPLYVSNCLFYRIMDFQNRPGGKTGGGGVASWSESNRDRRERLRQLALETIDLQKDPYFMKNHLGSYECKLCLTLHNNEGSYLAHTQGKKHQVW